MFVTCIFAIDVKPWLNGIQSDDRRNVQADDAWGNVGDWAHARDSVKREESIEEGQTISVCQIHQQATIVFGAVHAVTGFIELPASSYERIRVEDERSLCSKHHLIQCEDIDGSVRLAGDFIRDPLGQSVHVLSELIDGCKDRRVEHIADNEQVRRFTFIGEPFRNLSDSNCEI